MLPLVYISGSRQKGVLVLTCLAVTCTLVSALNKYGGQDRKHVAAKRQLYTCVPSSQFERCNQYGDLTAPPEGAAAAKCHCLNGSSCDGYKSCANGCDPGWYGPGCQIGNLGVGKTAWQSSTIVDYFISTGYPCIAGYAVDGLTPINSTTASCSQTSLLTTNNGFAWWAVILDTTRSYVVTNVTIVNRLGVYSNRLANFVILYSTATVGDPDPQSSDWPEYARERGTAGSIQTYTSSNVALAKRLAVYLTASPNNTGAILTLCEVQIYGYEPSAPPSVPITANCHCLNSSACDANGLCANGCESGWFGPGCQVGNVAFGKAARQSSTYSEPGYTGSANLAVDGRWSTTATVTPTYCTHTQVFASNNASWWVVTLDATGYYVIFNVTLVNRLSASSNRLANFVILYSNTTDGDPDPKNSTWLEYSRENGTVGFNATYTTSKTVKARRVAVYIMASPNNTAAILTLCEVQIYGSELFERTVAFSRMSTAAPWTVSGWTSTDSCCPYVYFDLGRLYTICGFESASDLNAATFANLEVRVGNSTTKNSDGFFVNPVCTFVDTLTSGMREFYPCRDFMVGRYISFMLVGAADPGPLTVSYFKVFASM